MNIVEFKEQYPQYRNIPDETLARQLHAKHYSSVDYDTFATKFGVRKTVPQQVKVAKADIEATQRQIMTGAGDKVLPHPLELDLIRHINRGTLTPKDQYVADLQKIRRSPGTTEQKDEAARERTRARFVERVDEIVAVRQNISDRKRWEEEQDKIKGKFLSKTYRRFERGELMVVGGGLFLADTIAKFPTPMSIKRGKPFGGGAVSENINNWSRMIHKALQEPELQPVIENAFDKYFGGAVETGPFLGASIGAAALTGGKSLPASVASFLVAYGVEGNNIYQTALDQGYTERGARIRGTVGGLINGGIEIVGGGGGKYLNAASRKTITKLGKAKYFSRRVLVNALKEGLAEELPQELVGMVLGGDTPTMDDGNVDFIEVAKRLVDAGIMGTILGGAMDVPFSAYGISKLPSIDRGTAVDVGIGRISIPGAVYNEAKIRAEESGGGVNPWIRQSDAEGNKGRTLMVQFNSDLITLEEDPQAKVYYDKLYSKRAGYRRLGDTWEIPKWMGEVNKTVPNADVYFVRDMSEAKEFLATSGYDHIAFSALDVNKENIKELAKDYRGDVSIGGYTDLKFFADLKNVKTYDSIQAMAEDRGHAYVPGTDYSHFEGSQTIPRLCMSKGCKHKCAFCIVPKGVTEMTPEIINNQADEIAKADAQLVYVDDKTFGQAKNHDMLAGMYDRIRSKNPEFEGFIVQTTAAQMQKLDEQMLRDAHVKFIEIGVESYNDAILKANKKPANEKLINEAAAKARRLGIDLIPNIIIGLPQETVETYARTLGWIEDNSDIISHMNIYNLAMYKGSELAESMGDTATLDDLNENKIKKSFHKEPEIHIAAANEFYQLGRSLLDTPLIGDSVPGTVDEAIGEQFGLTPLQTNELLSKAEDRYRLLKNKDVSKRSWQDKRELAFLSRKRGDVEALVGDYTSERPFTRGLWKKPKKPKKKILLRKGHQIPEQMGLTDEQRQNMQEIVTGKRSMAEMTKDEMIQWVNYLEAELAARGERYTPRQPVLPRLIEQLNRATKKEALSSAAIRLKSGEMLTGDTHSNILRDVAASGRTITNEEFDVPAGSGFMTNTGRFVSPEEGWKVGERAGQLRLEGDDAVMAQELIDKKYLVAEGIRYYAPLKSKIANNRITKYIAGKLRSPHQDFVRIERWLEAIDGFGTGLLHDVLWKRVKRADELRSIMTSQGQTAFVNLLEENNNDGALMSGKKETVGDHQLTSMEKIGVFLLDRNEHGNRYLTKGMAFTQDEITEIGNSLTNQELAIAEWLDEEYRSQWPVLRAAAMDVGVDPEVLEEELNYSPIVRVGDEGDIDFVSLLTEQFNRQSSKPEDGFLKQRDSRALGKLELDAGVIYMKNVQRIETFKAMAPVARDLGKVLSNPEFKAAFNNATDENGVKILNTWLRDTIKGSIKGPQTWAEKAIATMRKNGIIYAIGWNIPSVLRQTLSGFNAMAVDPLMLKYYPDNVARTALSPNTYNDMRDFVTERSVLVRTRKYDRDLRRKWDASRLAKRVQGKAPWDQKATDWIRRMDERTVTVAWKSLYDTAMEKTKGDEQAAIEFADQGVTRTQPMANMKDLPHFFRGGQIARLLSTFQNQINNNYNFYVHDIFGAKAAGKISRTEMGYRLMASWVLPAIAFGIIGRGGLPTDDGGISLKKLLIDLTTYPIASVMIAGRWINRMIKGWGNSGTVGEIAPEEAVRTFQAMKKGDIRGTIQHAAAAYGAATGRIPAQAIRTASGTLDLIAGDTRDPRRLVYTQWALDQGNVTKKSAGRIGLGPARGPASRGGPAGGPR